MDKRTQQEMLARQAPPLTEEERLERKRFAENAARGGGTHPPAHHDELLKSLARREALAEMAPRLAEALKELRAEAWGECPSLLNEDSGGNGILDCEIVLILEEFDRIQKGE